MERIIIAGSAAFEHGPDFFYHRIEGFPLSHPFLHFAP
jgi:hypothetical protein